LLMALGCFTIPIFPIGLELGVETTFPIAEATSSGILITFGQLLMFLLTEAMEQGSSSHLIYHVEAGQNFQLSMDIWCLTAIFSAIFALALLKPKYRRLEFEKKSRRV